MNLAYVKRKALRISKGGTFGKRVQLQPEEQNTLTSHAITLHDRRLIAVDWPELYLSDDSMHGGRARFIRPSPRETAPCIGATGRRSCGGRGRIRRGTHTIHTRQAARDRPWRRAPHRRETPAQYYDPWVEWRSRPSAARDEPARWRRRGACGALETCGWHRKWIRLPRRARKWPQRPRLLV